MTWSTSWPPTRRAGAAARTVASRVTVIAIPRARASVDDVGMQGRLVLMAVPDAEAADVAAAGLAGLSDGHADPLASPT